MHVGQFDLYDADGDNVVNETESRLILDSMITTQKSVMAEIFATQVSFCTAFNSCKTQVSIVDNRDVLAAIRWIICPRNARNLLLRV